MFYDVKLRQYNRLLEQIPELRFEANKPTAADHVKLETDNVIFDHIYKNSEIDAARLPFVEKHIKDLKPKFEEENKNLNPEDKAKLWEQTVIDAVKEI